VHFILEKYLYYVAGLQMYSIGLNNRTIMIKRIRLFELHDLERFPGIWRDLFTEFLSFYESSRKIYSPVASLFEPVIRASECFTIIDFCSGAGSPVLTVSESFDAGLADRVHVILTDKYPNIKAFKEISENANSRIDFINKPVDAINVPENLCGFRTFFSSFHHFNEDSASAILSDVVRKRQGIGIFEYTERALIKYLILFGIPLHLWLLLKFSLVRPVRWRRLFWTFIIPVLPVTVFWDGIVSCLRTYSERELDELARPFSDSGYLFKSGRIKSSMPFYITYLIGYPKV
jgi:hypothetical protein